MARGAAKARPKRAKPDTRSRRPSGGGSAKSVEQQLFFTRLRKTQKPMFIFLALVFAIGFVFFGVGSGSTGIADVLDNFTNIFGGHRTTSSGLDKARDRAKKHPNDAAAWRSLATALQQDGKDAEATKALEHYSKLRPKDDTALLQIGGYYSSRGQEVASRWEQAANEASTQSAFFQPTGLQATSGLAQAFAQDPIGQAFNTRAESLRQQTITAFQKSEHAYAALAAQKPKDQFSQFQYGEIARIVYLIGGDPNERTRAVTAIRRGIKLNPKSPEAQRAKQALEVLLFAQSQSKKRR